MAGGREGGRERGREIRGGPLSTVYFGGDNHSIIIVDLQQPNFLRRPHVPLIQLGHTRTQAS